MELLVVVAVIGAVVLIVRSRRSAAGVSFKPAGAFHPPRRLEARPASLRAVLALARREGVLLITHPAFVGGLLLFVPLMALIGMGFDEGSGVLSQKDGALNLMLVPMGWSAIVAANLCMLRSRRYGTDELLGADVVSPGSRTAAHLVACLATVPVSTTVAALFVLQRRLLGWDGLPRIEVFALGPLIVLGGAVLGVAVARWLPLAVFGWVAVIATFVLQVAYGEADPRFRWLHFSSHGNDTAFDLPELQIDHHGWHLVYVTGALLLVAAIALLRSPPTGTRVALLGLSVVMVALGIQGQLQSPTATQIEVLAHRLEDPLATQDCELIGTVTYCSWPRYASVHEGWSRPVEAVLTRVPDEVVDRPGGFVVSQRPNIRVRSRIDPDLRSQVDPRLVFRRESVVHAPYEWLEPSWSMDRSDLQRDFDLAYATALVAVGLPDRPWWDEGNADPSWATRRLHFDAGSDDIRWVLDALQTCRAGGEARTVVALWLAGQATDDPERVLTAAFADGGGGSLAELFPDEPYDTSIPPSLPSFGTLSTGDDVRGAIALGRVPVDHVTEVVRANWDELVDPATPVSRLFELVGQTAPDATPPSNLDYGAIIPPVSRCADLPEPLMSAP
jgi:hypothetical protein